MSVDSHVIGCGSFLPEKFITNEELSDILDTTDEWITTRTGIKKRHVAEATEMTSDLAFKAAKRALDDANISADQIDLIVLGTTTPDDIFPATAVKIQSRLGLKHGAAFDVQAACSGFIYALAIADSMIKTRQITTALVVGADTLTKLLDWKDRTTSVLFGDGAGAVVVTAKKREGSLEHSGVISTHIHSDGNCRELLYCNNEFSLPGEARSIQMAGKELFRQAVTCLADVVDEALQANNLKGEDIDWLVPHQANKRIIDSTAKKLKLPSDRVVLTIADHANTSAASIPLALDAAIKDGRIQRGDLLLMEAMGGGLTWGAALVRW
ncbi:MAG: beta-ketoacyl-ACP synthase III [Pseudomonadota bacterium]|nr:beta-ketoacyl-ACP synthase III [Pseudomonadota bacterium]